MLGNEHMDPLFGAVVQATSLGAEDMVVTDLIHRLGLPVAIGTLQTGALHEETVALIGRLEAHFGVQVEVYEPQAEAVVQFLRDLQVPPAARP